MNRIKFERERQGIPAKKIAKDIKCLQPYISLEKEHLRSLLHNSERYVQYSILSTE